MSEKNIKPIGNSTNPAKRIWDEYVDETGKSSLEIHTPKEVWRACDKHFFVAIDSLGNLQCRNCEAGQKIVWGIHKVKNGKIIKV